MRDMPLTASLLDEPRKLQSLDPQDMLGCVGRMPAVARSSFERGAAWSPPAARPRQILVCGMGGSAISGDLARTLLQPSWEIPLSVARQPQLPAWVDRDTLCLFLSYSGNTAETLAVFDEAMARGIPAAAIASGGQLQARCAERGLPVLPVETGWQPRAALGHLYFTLLGMLGTLGAPVDPEPAIARLEQLAREYGPDQPGNPAKVLAERLEASGATPLIAGTSPSTEAVSLRWKGQLNENAKAPALWGVFPELTHNEIVSLVASRQKRAVVVLRGGDEPDLLVRQIRETLGLIREEGIDAPLEIVASGSDPLERQMELVSLGDHASVYLAFLSGVDPTPVAPIVALKARLS